MKKTDLLWVLAFPIYYLVNSFRHELSHALSAVLEGARLMALSFWPITLGPAGQFWDGAIWQGGTTWVTSAMPYLFDLVTFLFFFYFCMAHPFQHRWVWVNLVIIGLISPVVNSGVNYLWLTRDIHELLQVFPPLAIDLYFCVTTVFYLTCLALALFASRTSLPSLPVEAPAG